MILDKQNLPPGLLTTIEETVWPVLREKFNPIVWKWYDANKDDKITKIFGIYTVTVGSFGIAAFVISRIIGDRQ